MLACFAAVVLAACGGDVAPAPGGGGGEGGAGAAGGAGGGEVSGLAALLPGAPPVPWADPIADYLQAGQEAIADGDFLRGIHDLSVYEGRLYLGYGDANENLGRIIPIGVRSFASASDPVPSNERDTDEEHIERYRAIGEGLYIAGVDATEDAFLGNVYWRQPRVGWKKSRTLQGGVHVHDVAGLGGAVYGVGSGATAEEWVGGDIYAHLWRSTGEGEPFEVVERVHNGGDGDARWVRLMPFGDVLYLFGYTSNASFSIDAFIPARYDGVTLTRLGADDPLARIFVQETDCLSPSLCVLRGVDTNRAPLVHGVWTMDPAGALSPVAALAGRTVVDVFVHPPTGEAMVLSFAGDAYPRDAAATAWELSLHVTADFAELTEVLAWTSEVLPASVAYFDGALFLGTDEGQVWRSAR